jgi:hypothetical protein
MVPDATDNRGPSPGEPRIEQHPGSLLNEEAMGGIRGGKGFDYQDRYIVCHYPEWGFP